MKIRVHLFCVKWGSLTQINIGICIKCNNVKVVSYIVLLVGNFANKTENGHDHTKCGHVNLHIV
jgi:hypothetical protein